MKKWEAKEKWMSAITVARGMFQVTAVKTIGVVQNVCDKMLHQICLHGARGKPRPRTTIPAENRAQGQSDPWITAPADNCTSGKPRPRTTVPTENRA